MQQRQSYHRSSRKALFPFAFYSKAFDETQMRYSILDKELYAMVNAIKHFEFYLQGRKFKIFTDSKILYYLREAKESNPKLMRWSLLLRATTN